MSFDPDPNAIGQILFASYELVESVNDHARMPRSTIGVGRLLAAIVGLERLLNPACMPIEKRRMMSYSTVGWSVRANHALNEIRATHYEIVFALRLEDALHGKPIVLNPPFGTIPPDALRAMKCAVDILASEVDTAIPREADPPADLISMRVALERFDVSRTTLIRGGFADYRKPGSPPNAERVFSESELAARYERRG